MKTSLIAPFFATLKAANPLPNTELEYTSVFELLTAVLLSAQATDVSVNKATRKLFVVAHTPQAMLDLGQEGLESHIKTIGLFRSKAKHLLATCRILVEQHASAVPRTRAELEALPGVVVSCRALGILKMEDEAGMDGKVLAVPTNKVLGMYSAWKNIEDVNPARLKALSHFFEHYKDLEDGKWVKVLGWEGIDEAHKEILDGLENYRSALAAKVAV